MQDVTLPPRGGWIMITRDLPTQVRPPVLSIWYAMPDRLFPYGWHERTFVNMEYGDHLKGRDLAVLWRYRHGNRSMLTDELEFAKKHEEIQLEQRVKITTPWGDVCVEPYEWSSVKNVELYFDMIGDGVILHEFGGTAKTSSKMEEQIFYMQTRGLDRAGALRLLLGDVKKPNIVWLEMEQELVDYFFPRRNAA